ncbi:hypothetical protein GQ44DRAFT_724560 [Phaeosphaeriaceae sp. PMI808]|nr:hypothetical protein GQ44DRAFT_724560 [Phaeosphaeriaceae sp. PMI808]
MPIEEEKTLKAPHQSQRGMYYAYKISDLHIYAWSMLMYIKTPKQNFTAESSISELTQPGRRVREALQDGIKSTQSDSGDSNSEEIHREDEKSNDRNSRSYVTPRTSQDLYQHQFLDPSFKSHMDLIDPNLYAGSCPDTPTAAPLSNIMIDDAFVPDDLVFQSDLSWAHIDPMITLPVANEGGISHNGFLPQPCQACNGTTTPEYSHLDIFPPDLPETIPSRSIPQLHHNHHVPSGKLTPPNSRQTPPHQSGQIKLSDSGPQSHKLATERENKRVRRSATMPSIQPSWGPSVTEHTRRFGLILDTMRSVGFRDFDEMVGAYYMTHFEKGSYPSMMQSASRSRRLKALLRELQDSSGQWPRWEARGLHESVSEATASLCIKEMERLNEMELPSSNSDDLAGLITAFETLLGDPGHSIRNNPSSHPKAIIEMKGSGQVEGAPDSMPHLWSLLTELAGAHGEEEFMM